MTELLERTFAEEGDHNEMVMLRGVEFQSHCKHHMVPIIGIANVAYIPNDRVVGISKLVRVVDTFAKRLQIEERFTAQIADAIGEALSPRGVAVVIEAQHQCMTTRGVKKPDVAMITACLRGAFEEDAGVRAEFLGMLRG